jgi:2-amino-4-hydroxy-6-hydroxymethyldihydropteridine diphosphokinase
LRAAWIGLGANLGARARTLDGALARMDRLPATRVGRVSGYYRTAPWGEPDQPEFLNAVAELHTDLSAEELLEALQSIEAALGRTRSGKRWGPRTIDLDILLFGSAVIATPQLEVPHPRISERAFVLVPLAELDGALEVPGRGRVDDMLRALDDHERAGVQAGPQPAFESEPELSR